MSLSKDTPEPNDEPSGMPEMPGKVRNVRTLTFAVAGLNLVIALLYVTTAMFSAEDLEQQNIDPGTYYLVGAIFLLHAGVGARLALLLARGGANLRTGLLVWAVTGTFLGLITAPLGLVNCVLTVMVIIFLFQAPARDWFERARS